MAHYEVGDRVRLTQVSPGLYRDDPVDRETAEFFERCLGSEFRVEGFDEYGQLELWVTAEGGQAPNRLSHMIWIESEYVGPCHGRCHGSRSNKALHRTPPARSALHH